jgi:hypothetical protein
MSESEIEAGESIEVTELIDDETGEVLGTVVDDVVVATSEEGTVVEETIDVFDSDGDLVVEDDVVSVYDADGDLVAEEETTTVALDEDTLDESDEAELAEADEDD